MRTWITAAALLASLVIAPAAADAHTLSKRGAARLARAAASQFAHSRARPHELIERVGGGPGYCVRGSAHRVVCAVAWTVALEDGYQYDDGTTFMTCAADVRVRYLSARRVRTRVYDADCL